METIGSLVSKKLFLRRPVSLDAKAVPLIEKDVEEGSSGSVIRWVEENLQVSRDVLFYALAVKGLLFGVIQPWQFKAMPYWFNAHGSVSASTRSILESMAASPWGFRSLVCAAMVPSHRFGGRKGYLATLQTMSIVAFLVVGLVNPADFPLQAATACFFLTELAAVANAVVVDGHISRAVRSIPNSRDSHRLASTFYLMLNACAILSLPIIGLCLDRLPASRSFAPCLVFVSVVVLVLVVAFLDDTSGISTIEELKDAPPSPQPNSPGDRVLEPLGKWKNSEKDLKKLEEMHMSHDDEECPSSSSSMTETGAEQDESTIDGEDRPSSLEVRLRATTVDAEDGDCAGDLDEFTHALVALAMGIMSGTIVLLPLAGVHITVLFCISVAFAACAGFANYRLLGPSIGLINAYQQISLCCRPNLNSAQFLFFTDQYEHYPRGPHLSPLFYTTAIGYVSQLFTFVGILAYRNFLAHIWSTKSIFRIAAMLVFCAQLLALPVYARWLVNYPILDKGFILFEEAVLVIVNSLTDIPLFLLLSRRCRGCNDATVLALCSTARHLCTPVSVYGGVLLLTLFKVNPNGTDGDADALKMLWQIKAVAACITVLPAIFFLDRMIPSAPLRKTATVP